jgi:transglutaminase-like putative cysteine protease
VTRWVVWTWVGVMVILFAANVDRLMPPENVTYYYDHIMDRLITAFYAVGVATLFFKLSGRGVTTIMISVLPMLMLTLSRTEGRDEWLNGPWNVPLMGFLLLAITLDQVSQLLRPPEQDQRLIPFWREMGLRYGLLLMVVAVGLTLRQPLQGSVEFVQKQLLGLVTKSLRSNSKNSDLSLSRPFPKHFAERTRVMLLIQGREAPGYLREIAYTNYQHGRWLLPKQTKPLLLSAQEPASGKKGVYRLIPAQVEIAETNTLWKVEVLTPYLFSAISLPGHARSFSSEKREYVTDDNGIVTSETVVPDRYEVATPEQRVANKAYPLPSTSDKGVYLYIPSELTNAVQGWITRCDGFAETQPSLEAARTLERYFQHNFTYNLDANLKGKTDPLIMFMEKREGFCIHFASAAVLMLRGRGIPARVVAGFVSFGYDPWLKRWVVRERERHAWVELWDETEQRWLLLDPTPLAGRPSASGEVNLFRRLLDVASASWKRFIFWLRSANFLLVLAEAGLWCFELFCHFLRSPLGWGTLVLAFAGLWWRRRRRFLRLSPEERERLRMRKQMDRRMKKSVPAALRRRESESWDGWLRRIEGKIPEATYQDLRVYVEAYQCRRYRTLTK